MFLDKFSWLAQSHSTWKVTVTKLGVAPILKRIVAIPLGQTISWRPVVSKVSHCFLSNFQVPIPLPPQRRRFLAIKWLITAAREQQKTNKNARMYKKLAKELLSAYNNEVTNDSDTPCTCQFNIGQNFVFNWPKWIEARISFAVNEKNSGLQSKVKLR